MIFKTGPTAAIRGIYVSTNIGVLDPLAAVAGLENNNLSVAGTAG